MTHLIPYYDPSNSFQARECLSIELGCVSCDTAHITHVDQCYPTDPFLNKNRQYAQYARKFPCLAVSANKEPYIVSRPTTLNSYPLLGLPGTSAEQKQQYKNTVLNHSSNYIGTSKKMQYGKYAQTTPGLTTFANKKYAALQPAVAQKQQCFATLCSNF